MKIAVGSGDSRYLCFRRSEDFMKIEFPANYSSRQLIQSHIYRPEDLPGEHIFAARVPFLYESLLSVPNDSLNYITKSKTLNVFRLTTSKKDIFIPLITSENKNRLIYAS
jgi:hypothetical protein